LPVPEHAFEVDYTYNGRLVVALRMGFPDEATSAAFFRARLASLRGCQGRSGGPAVGVLVAEVDAVSPTVVLSDRTPDSDGWTELAVLRGRDVLLMAAKTPFGTAPLRQRNALDIERLLGETE
jgi:hypothetical protein